jgi:hypothetical protein
METQIVYLAVGMVASFFAGVLAHSVKVASTISKLNHIANVIRGDGVEHSPEQNANWIYTEIIELEKEAEPVIEKAKAVIYEITDEDDEGN